MISSNLAPWNDLVFGTYHCPANQDFEVGLPGQPQQSYLGWMLRPGWDEASDSRDAATETQGSSIDAQDARDAP